MSGSDHETRPLPPVPADATARVRSTVHSHWRRTVRARRVRRLSLWLGLPAAAGLALALALWLRPRAERAAAPASSPAPVIVARLEAATGSGAIVFDGPGRRWVDLAAGEGVQAGAALRTGHDGLAAFRMTNGMSLRARERTHLRLVSESEIALEQGSVYIDHEPSSGLSVAPSVKTPAGTVRDIGTQFEVRFDAQVLRVRVREGTVVLERDSRVTAASAGTELRAGWDQTVEREPISISGRDWRWVVELAPPLDIEGRPLPELLSWVTREMGWRLVYEDEATAAAAAGIILHGTIAGLSPDEAVSSVLATCELASRVDGGRLIVRSIGSPRR